MGKLEQISVGLPVEVLDAIRRAVAAGEYASESDAVADALRAWQDARDVFGIPERELGSLWDAGIASGPGRFSLIDDLVAEAERRARSSTG